MTRQWLQPLTLCLVAASVILAGIAVWPWLPESAAAPPVPEVLRPAADGVAAASLPPLADFAVTAARPLFAPTRRPPAATQDSLFAAGIEGRYRLQGLFIAGKARRALLVEEAGGRTLQVGEGDTVEGWTVRKIEQDRLILASPAGETTLALRQAPAKP
jgi:general secretion pathway protein N